VHIEDERALRHEEFLDLSREPPMRALAERLIGVLGDSGPVLMYANYELQAINSLIEIFPDLVDQGGPALHRTPHELRGAGWNNGGHRGRGRIPEGDGGDSTLLQSLKIRILTLVGSTTNSPRRENLLIEKLLAMIAEWNFDKPDDQKIIPYLKDK
jgi:hypothetical protein